MTFSKKFEKSYLRTIRRLLNIYFYTFLVHYIKGNEMTFHQYIRSLWSFITNWYLIFKRLTSFCPNHRLLNVYKWASLPVLIFFSTYRIIKFITPLSFYLLSLSHHLLFLSLPLSSLKLTYVCQGERDRYTVQENYSLYWSSTPTPAGAWTHELWNPLS